MDEDQIKEMLRLWPGSRRGANGVIIDSEYGMFYATDIAKIDSDLTSEESMYVQICAKSEIIRLRNIRSAHDYLLRIRAEAIMNSSRLTRSIQSRRRKFESGGRPWNLSQYYASLNDAPKRYISKLQKSHRSKILAIPFGYAPLNEANAACIGSLVGDLVVASETLRYFYYFMTICFYGREWGFKVVDCVDAGLIALRIMNGAESQDFDIDPRESLSPRLRGLINQQVDAMIQFTFGHEFAHFLLGHTSAAGSIRVAAHSESLKTFAHNQEYEADVFAIKAIANDPGMKKNLITAAYNLFLYLHFLQTVHSSMSAFPNFSVSQTHPAPLERLRALNHSTAIRTQTSEASLSVSIQAIEEMRDLILSRIENSGRSHDLLSFYGSIHIAGLGGKPGRDRIDY